MECAQVTEEQRLWTETQIQKAKHNECLAELSRLSLPDSLLLFRLCVAVCAVVCEHNSDVCVCVIANGTGAEALE